ncbi:minor capsid protein [Sphingomonas phage Kimi]|nr:minor capsid protein [Sphingomonas phage Kimi]
MANIYDIIVRHQIYLEGLKLGTATDFNSTSYELGKSIRAELADLNYEDLGDMSRRKLQELLGILKEIARGVFTRWLNDLIAFLEDFTREDIELLTSVFNGADEFENEELEQPDEEKARKFIFGLPMAAGGMTMLAFLRNFTASGVVRLDRTVNMAWANHDSPAELTRALVGTRSLNFKDGLIARLSREATAASDTVLQHIASQLVQRVSEQVTSEYEWVSVLDDRTTKICRGRDGKIYIFGRGPLPPAHVRCRSTVMPYYGTKAPEETFNGWTRRQPLSVIKDMFDGRASSTYEGTRALTLAQFRGKRGLILAD